MKTKATSDESTELLSPPHPISEVWANLSLERRERIITILTRMAYDQIIARRHKAAGEVAVAKPEDEHDVGNGVSTSSPRDE